MAWPGVARVSKRVTDGTSARSALNRKDPTYPAAVAAIVKSPERAAQQAALEAGEKRRTGVPASHREKLVDGRTFGTRDHALNLAMRYVEGGRQTFLEMIQRLAYNGDSDAQAIMQIYDDLSTVQRERIDLDTLVFAAGVLPNRIMGKIVDETMQVGRDVAEMVASTTLPALMARTNESAMRIDGDHAEIALKDRHALLGHQKMIPVPKGASVHVHAHAQAAAAAQAQPSVPTFAESIDAANRATRAVQALDPAEVIDGCTTEN